MARLVSAIIAGVLACGLAGTAALAKEEEKKEIWVPVENKANCAVWAFPLDKGETGTWTGNCRDGKAEDKGVLTWRGPTKDGKGWTNTFAQCVAASRTARVCLIGGTANTTKAGTRTARSTAMALSSISIFSTGPACTRANGGTASGTERENLPKNGVFTKAGSRTVIFMGAAFIHTATATDTRASSRTTRSTVSVFSFGRTTLATRAAIRTAR